VRARAPGGAAGGDNPYLALAAPGICDLAPYEPGKPVEDLERELGITGALKLASNENPLGASPAARAAAAASLETLAIYPDGNGLALKQALARHHGLTPAHMTLGNGSNDVLDLVARSFLTPEHEAVYAEHAFAVYALATRTVGATGREVPARDYGHDPEAMLAAVNGRTRVVFIANPNNPTGTWVDADALRAFLDALPDTVIAVVDEAYFEYVTEPGYPDATRWLDEFPNLLVTRTFSKVYGLAALRVGYGVSNPDIAELLNRARQPFNVNAVGLAAARTALEDREFVERSVSINREGLAVLRNALDERGIGYIPSVGNFVAVDVGRPAGPVYEALLRQGVIVRPIAGYGLPRHLRITVGQPEQNRRVIAALDAALEAS
jgi:histidinol-phosphate aminotransferase